MPEEKKNNNLGIIIGIIVLVVLIIVGIVAFTNLGSSDDEAQEDDDTTVVEDDKMNEEEGVMVGGALMSPDDDLITNASKADNLTTLVAAVEAAGLSETLMGPGPFTVFAPEDSAFATLPDGTVENLLLPENRDQLIGILQYHVVSGRLLAEDLSDGDVLETLQGDTLEVTVDGDEVMINGATVDTADVLQSNGVAHIIDGVLLPNPLVGGAVMVRTNDIVSNLVTAPNLSTVVAAVTQAGLVETLQGEGPFTVFGPENTAFEALPAGTLDSLLLPANQAQLTGILTYHVVPGLLLTEDLEDGQELTTVNGDVLIVGKDATTGVVTLTSSSGNVATITTPDVRQSNGVAHIIDAVLLPAS